jgi:hypothetical protein
MEEILSAADAGNEFSIDRCRELLGDEAAGWATTRSIEFGAVPTPWRAS